MLPQWTITNKLSVNDTTTPSIIRVINTITANLTQIFTSILKKVQLDSIILTSITVSGKTIIPHTLGRTLSGWQIVRQRSEAQVWDNQDSSPNPNVYLVLNSSASVVVDILIF